MSETAQEQKTKSLEELSVNDFTIAEIKNWITTSDDKLVEEQTPYIVVGSISGRLPVRYSAPIDDYDIEWDPLLHKMRFRSPLKYRQSNKTIGLSEEDVLQARFGLDALSEMTIENLLKSPDLFETVLNEVDKKDETVKRNIVALRQNIDLIRKNLRMKKESEESNKRSGELEEVGRKLAKLGLSAEQVTLADDEEKEVATSSNNEKAYWSTKFGYEGNLGGGTPKNSLQIGKK